MATPIPIISSGSGYNPDPRSPSKTKISLVLGKNIMRVSLKKPFTPRYLTDTIPHNLTMKTNEEAYLYFFMYSPPDSLGKIEQIPKYILIKYRAKNYFVFDILPGNKEYLNEYFEMDEFGGLTKQKDFEEILERIIINHQTLSERDFCQIYMK